MNRAGRSRLVLSDAEILIDLARAKLLDLLFESRTVRITERLFSECTGYRDLKSGKFVPLLLDRFIKSGNLMTESVPLDTINEKFAVKMIEFNVEVSEMHEGEMETAVYVFNDEKSILCSGNDKMVMFMTHLGLAERTASLESILGGLFSLPMKYSEIMRRAWIKACY